MSCGVSGVEGGGFVGGFGGGVEGEHRASATDDGKPDVVNPGKSQ